jgi:hypothetical protein
MISKFCLTTLLLLTGCGFHTQINKEASELNVKETDTTEAQKQDVLRGRALNADQKFKAALAVIEISNMNLAKTAQPGSVTFAGVAASQDSASKITPHEKIHLDPEKTPVSIREIEADELASLNDVTNRKTFINAGCGKLNPKKVAGLTEVKMKIQHGFLHAHADKVFLCGRWSVSWQNAVLSTNELVMDHLSVVQMNGPGIFNIFTKTLSLIGDNHIVTLDQQVGGDPKAGSPIFFSVLDRIQGLGSLQID